MELIDLYRWRMTAIEKALDAHKNEEVVPPAGRPATALWALGRIRAIIGMSDAEVQEEYTAAAEGREPEPNWPPEED